MAGKAIFGWILIIGWVLNAYYVIQAMNDEVTAVFVIQAMGIIAFPLGAVLGWVFLLT